jgi:hypothetical protein
MAVSRITNRIFVIVRHRNVVYYRPLLIYQYVVA